jgi:predicted kinase
MLVGLPGSGKTTWAYDNFPEIPIVGTDFWVERLARARDQTYTEAFNDVIQEATRLFDEEVRNLTQQKQSFVWDQTNTTVGSRRGKLMRLQGYQVVGHVWILEDSELQRRRSLRLHKQLPTAVLADMASRFSSPTPDQGFHQVITHRE